MSKCSPDCESHKVLKELMKHCKGKETIEHMIFVSAEIPKALYEKAIAITK